MNKYFSALISVFLLFSPGISISAENTAAESLNMSLISRIPEGECRAVDASGHYAYIGNGGALDVVDIFRPGKTFESRALPQL